MKKLFASRSPQGFLTKIALEMISIIAAVLIALAVNEWNMGRNNQNNARAALVKIASELEQNIRLLEKAHVNNQQIIDNIGKPDQSGEFQPVLHIQQTAWQTALSTGAAEHIDYEVLYVISQAYAIQEMHKNLSYDLIKSMMHTNATAIALNDNINSSTDLPNNAHDDYFILVVTTEKYLLQGLKVAHERLKDLGY